MNSNNCGPKVIKDEFIKTEINSEIIVKDEDLETEIIAFQYEDDTVDRTKTSFECQVCSGCFIAKRDLSRHKNIHTGEQAFKCQFCSRSFADKYILNIYE